MSRRRSNSSKQILIWSVLGVAIAAGLVFAMAFLVSRSGKHFPELTDLDFQRAMQDGNSLRGSEYRAHGKVIYRTFSEGDLLIGVQSLDEDRLKFVSFLVPDGVSKINIEQGREYYFRVKIEQEGFGVVSDVKLP